MSDESERRALLARAWDEAADEYERYFVPRFAPWVARTVEAVIALPLPPGPILVPCCGTFPELPALVERLPGREIIGIDLSAGMVRLAQQRAERFPRARAVQGDAATLGSAWIGACAGVVSVFGLQQLPRPTDALREWTSALRADGRIAVMFWTGETEEHGPFALLSQVLDGHRPAADNSWHMALGDAITTAGGTVERDEYPTFPMAHDSAEAFWSAMADGGPLHATAIARGEDFMAAMRERFLELAPAGPWRHQPRARLIVARR